MTATLSPEDKAFLTCQARGAILGVRVLRCFDGRNRPIFFISHDSAWTREFQSLDALVQMLERMEGKV